MRETLGVLVVIASCVIITTIHHVHEALKKDSCKGTGVTKSS